MAREPKARGQLEVMTKEAEQGRRLRGQQQQRALTQPLRPEQEQGPEQVQQRPLRQTPLQPPVQAPPQLRQAQGREQTRQQAPHQPAQPQLQPPPRMLAPMEVAPLARVEAASQAADRATRPEHCPRQGQEARRWSSPLPPRVGARVLRERCRTQKATSRENCQMREQRETALRRSWVLLLQSRRPMLQILRLRRSELERSGETMRLAPSRRRRSRPQVR